MVWFGTDNGLTRFDGKSFTTFTKTKDCLANNSVRDIWQDAEGVLWIANGAGVTRYDSNVWSTLSGPDGLDGNEVYRILHDKDGAYWFTTEKGLTRYLPGRTPPKPPRLLVQADKEFSATGGPAQLTSGRRAVFKFNAVDLKTRAETRRNRWQIVEGTPAIDGSRHAKGWLTEKLREEETRTLPDLRDTLELRMIEQFALRLRGWGGEYDAPILLRYANALFDQAQQFDLDKLPKTLEQFSSVIEKIAERARQKI